MTGSLLLRNAHVLDVEAGDYRELDLLCVDGRVAEADSRLSGSTEVPELDVRGAHVLPGLIDCHVHVIAVSANLSAVAAMPPSYVTAGAIRNMGRILDRGFTTVRDTGGADYGLVRAREHGFIRGPRLIFGGKSLSQTGGHGDKRPVDTHLYDDHPCCAGTGRVVDGVDAVRQAAREELRKGAHHIKVHASGGVSSPADHINATQYSMAELRAVVEEVEAAERYVTVHAYPARAINRALEAGVHCVEHGNLLDERSIELFLQHNAFLVPTLVTYWALQNEGMDHGLPRVSWEKVGQVLEGGLSALERAAREGVQLAFGTDLLGGMQQRQNEEFRIRAQVQQPIEIIRAATMTAARLVGMPGDIGTLAPGAHADLVVLNDDPLQNIDALANPANIRLVVQAGAVVKDARS
ncbi:MAG: amidohydrolase family protein [Pseudonocardiaceae bacterium]|nr:amidohydrolase family protein [Pseudonocardiaceae bacterium]